MLNSGWVRFATNRHIVYAICVDKASDGGLQFCAAAFRGSLCTLLLMFEPCSLRDSKRTRRTTTPSITWLNLEHLTFVRRAVRKAFEIGLRWRHERQEKGE
uniref:Uncharacterized protein n=1 Tax=Peronospora matthiolae TaxID=2874970 RepID=A0AAV1SZY0_9STRA